MKVYIVSEIDGYAYTDNFLGVFASKESAHKFIIQTIKDGNGDVSKYIRTQCDNRESWSGPVVDFVIDEEELK